VVAEQPAEQPKREERPVTHELQAKAFTASMQQCWSEGMAMALAGTEALQEQGKTLVEKTLELASARTNANLKCIEELSAQMTAAAQQAEMLFREQLTVLGDLPNDPIGAKNSRRFVRSFSTPVGANIVDAT
jgi:hypothetical protein